ncbi:MAG TPA: hypothetical protein VEA41_06740 [Salinarimonas sp.]|jgi:hypothetical protein|nr:hypothetical protein [Salinarimonas sp.]
MTTRNVHRAPRLDPSSRTRIGLLLRAVHLPPETSPLPDEQVEMVLALRRKDRERQGRR